MDSCNFVCNLLFHYFHFYLDKILFQTSLLPFYYILKDIGTVEDEIVYIPDKYEGKLVKEIAEYAFEGTSFTNITIPNTVVSIGQYAFYGCVNLQEVEIPNSVEVLGDAAFYGCTVLEKAIAGNGVQSIGAETFYGCLSLSNLTLGQNVRSIGDSAFYGCIITTATIPTYVISSMQKSALVTLVIDGGEEIVSNAFKNCTNLETLTIMESVKTIGASAFYGCTSLSAVYYGGDVEDWCNISFGNESANPLYCGKNLYINNEKVETLVIPETVS